MPSPIAAVVDLDDAGEFAHRSGAKNFIGAVSVIEFQIGFRARNFFGCANLEHGRARDSFRASNDAARRDLAVAHDENMRRVRLRDESVNVEHERIVGAGVVRFDLGQNGVEQD